MKTKEKAIKQLFGNLDFIQGTMVSLYRRCGKKGCACQKGDGHGPAYYISIKENNKTRMVYIPTVLEKEVRKRMVKHRKVKRLLREISRINIQTLKEAYVRGKR